MGELVKFISDEDESSLPQPPQKGIPALEEIARWTDARLSEAELPENLRRTMKSTWTYLPFRAELLSKKENHRTG